LAVFYGVRLVTITFDPQFHARVSAFLTMSLDLSDVKRIANLAQLELSDTQATDTLAKLNGIFSLVEQLKAVDTTGITPLSHPIAALMPELCLRLREDVVTESNHRDDYLKVAPATQDGLYLVPKVIE
jgi:aspartyl-tRNA(Asn)/glutamyl-tRNA(Gln) amidotransferase subunit C